MFYIPSIQTIKEYNNLKTTKQPIKMTKETTEMDKFIYNKYNGLENIGLLGSNIVFLGMCLKNHPEIPLKRSLIGLAGFFAMTLLAVFCSKNRREKYFDDIKSKRRMYEKQGLIAVI